MRANITEQAALGWQGEIVHVQYIRVLHSGKGIPRTELGGLRAAAYEA
jgi:hypothetical protein